jgi:IS30 family transposase
MTRLTYYERQIIELCVKSNWGVRQIARHLGRAVSTISNELKPDKDQGKLPYSAKRGQLRAERMSHNTNKRKLDKDPVFGDWVRSCLSQDWSPEQIVGRLKEFPGELPGRSVCVETIYQFVYDDRLDIQDKPLYKHLRTRRGSRIKQGKRRSNKTCIPERVAIKERPTIITNRKRYGDWEADSLLGKARQPIAVQLERKARLVRLTKLEGGSSEETAQAISRQLDELPEVLIKSMTFDNGPEFARHTQVRDNYHIPTYFCQPYSPYQKGAVENVNKLIRQYIPKGADLTNYSDQDIYQIQEKLNNRPRKSLQYKTPNEILQALIK